MSILRKERFVSVLILQILIFAAVSSVFADANFDRLFSEKKYKEAIDYADGKIPNDKRTSQLWAKIGQANEATGFVEKALACYMVAWRLKSDEYLALLGIARIYNDMGQPEQAVSMAESAIKANFTAEASWEYARACIALKRPADAKAALQKIIASDSTNVIANRELGNIYYNDGEFARALTLMKRSYREKADGTLAFRIGRAFFEVNMPDSAVIYLQRAVDRKSNVSEASLYMARAHYGRKKYGEAAAAYSKVGKNNMTALDHYFLGFSREKSSDAAGAFTAYEAAVQAYGNSKDKEALLARAFVAREHLRKNAPSAALPHLLFIVKHDEKAATVSDIHFLLADAYAITKDNPKAISSLERAIALNSKNIEAYARLAELYEKTGQGERAKKTYELMMSISPNDPGVYVTLGNYNLKAKKWKEAMSQFEKSGSLKRSGVASEGVAVAAFNMGDMQKALEAARVAVELDPNLIGARAVMAGVLIRNKDYKRAQEQAEWISKKEPGNLDYLKMLAVCYENNKELDKLAETDRKIAGLDKKDIAPRLRLAAYAESKNDAATAISMLKEVVAVNPKHADSYRRLAALTRERKQLPEALGYIKKYIELVPNNAEAHRDMGDILYDQKNMDAALAAYRTAIKIDPKLKGFHKRYAEIVIAKGQTSEVITALTGAIKNGGADIGTYTTLGMIYQERKQFKEALDVYSQALKLEPANFDVLSALAACQLAAGQTSAAAVTYEQAVMMNPNAGSEYKALGDIYTAQKKNADALRSYIKYLDKMHDDKAQADKAVAARVGKLLYEEKKYADAAKYLSLVGSTEPGSLFMYADASFRSGNLKNAIAALETLRNRKPRVSNISNVLPLLAEAYEKDGKPDLAAKAYVDFIALPGAKNADAAYKAAFLQEKSNPAAATKIYEANTRSYPKDIRNFLRLGLMYSQKKETLSKALPLLQKCVAAADTMPNIWLELAKVYGAMDRDDDELDAYRKYAKADPRHAEANKRIGELLMKKGDMDNAMIHLELANTVSPNDPAVMALLARGYLRAKRSKEAIDMLARAKAAKPDDIDIRYQLYEIYSQTNQRQKAIDEIRQLADMTKDSRFMLPYGEALIAQNKIKDAERVADDLIDKEPENINALMLRAKVLRARKNWEGALEIYKEISDVYPDLPAPYYERAETFMLAAKPTLAEPFYKRALRADPQFGPAELGLAKFYRAQKQMDLHQKHLAAAQKLAPDNPEVLEEVRKFGGKK